MLIHNIIPERLLCMALYIVLAGCKGAPGGEKQQGEKWHMTNEIVEVNPDQNEEDFLQAALDGNLERVSALQKLGVDCNAADQDGRTALMLAAFNGHSEIVSLLIEVGAEVDQLDYLDRTALHYGSTGPFPGTVTILLENGADPNLMDSGEHFTPLMHAAAEGHLEVVKLLVQYGADRYLKDVDGDDAVAFAARAGHVQVVRYLNSEE